MQALLPHAAPAERLYQEKERTIASILNHVDSIDTAEDVLQSAFMEALASGAIGDSCKPLCHWIQPFLARSIKCNAYAQHRGGERCPYDPPIPSEGFVLIGAGLSSLALALACTTPKAEPARTTKT